MSLERRFGVGMLALGVGEAALAVAALAPPHSDPLTGWSLALIALGSVGLGVVLLSGRTATDVTETQRRLVRVIANASMVGGVAGTIGGVLLLADALLA